MAALVLVAVVAAALLAVATGSMSPAGPVSRGHHRVRPAAAVTYEGAGGSCVNVWMGGNPQDPNACRPPPAGR